MSPIVAETALVAQRQRQRQRIHTAIVVALVAVAAKFAQNDGMAGRHLPLVAASPPSLSKAFLLSLLPFSLSFCQSLFGSSAKGLSAKLMMGAAADAPMRTFFRPPCVYTGAPRVGQVSFPTSELSYCGIRRMKLPSTPPPLPASFCAVRETVMLVMFSTRALRFFDLRFCRGCWEGHPLKKLCTTLYTCSLPGIWLAGWQSRKKIPWELSPALPQLSSPAKQAAKQTRPLGPLRLRQAGPETEDLTHSS